MTAQTRTGDQYAWTGSVNVNRSYTANGLKQLTTAGAVALGYDARGNLTSSGADAYTYDSENRLLTGPQGSLLGAACPELVSGIRWGGWPLPLRAGWARRCNMPMMGIAC